MPWAIKVNCPTASFSPRIGSILPFTISQTVTKMLSNPNELCIKQECIGGARESYTVVLSANSGPSLILQLLRLNVPGYQSESRSLIDLIRMNSKATNHILGNTSDIIRFIIWNQGEV